MGGCRQKNVRKIEKHLAACASCRLSMEQFRSVAVLLDQLPVIELPLHLMCVCVRLRLVR
jgi:hypothetical protein